MKYAVTNKQASSSFFVNLLERFYPIYETK